MTEIAVSVTDACLQPGQLDLALAQHRDSGARVVFCGQARAEQGSVTALEVEHFPGMAEHAIRTICEQAAKKWPVNRIVVVHRVGRVPVGEDLVQVGVSAQHRREAFLACTFVMDFLKTRAPFWKKQIGPDGERWVEAKVSDAEAAGAWLSPEHER